MKSFTPDSTVQMSVGGPSGGDLYFVVLAHTGSGTTEIHARAASSNYTSYSLHSTSSLPTGYATTQVRFLVAHGTGDLYLVLHAKTDSGRTEAHALTGASRYRSFSVHAALPIGYTNDNGAHWVLGTGAKPDLTLVQLLGTGTHKVEAHKLTAASSYRQWSLHAVTDRRRSRTPYGSSARDSRQQPGSPVGKVAVWASARSAAASDSRHCRPPASLLEASMTATWSTRGSPAEPPAPDSA